MENIPGVRTSAFTGDTGNEHDMQSIVDKFMDVYQNNMEVCADFKICLSEHKRTCTESGPCCKINNISLNETWIMFLGFDDLDKINLECVYIQNDAPIKKKIEEHLKVWK